MRSGRTSYPRSRSSTTFRDQLRDPDVIELPDVGHVPMYDHPTAVARLISEHATAQTERSERSGLICRAGGAVEE